MDRDTVNKIKMEQIRAALSEGLVTVTLTVAGFEFEDSCQELEEIVRAHLEGRADDDYIGDPAEWRPPYADVKRAARRMGVTMRELRRRGNHDAWLKAVELAQELVAKDND